MKKTILLFVNVFISFYVFLVMLSVHFEIQNDIGVLGSGIYKLVYTLSADYSLIFATSYCVLSCACLKKKEQVTREVFVFIIYIYAVFNAFLSIILTLFDFNTGRLGYILYGIIESTIGIVGLVSILIYLAIVLIYHKFYDKVNFNSILSLIQSKAKNSLKNTVTSVKKAKFNTHNEADEYINHTVLDDCELINVLNTFNINVSLANVINGNSVIRYQLTPARGVRVSSIKQLDSEISLALRVKNVDITVNDGYVCVDVPKPDSERRILKFENVMNTPEFINSDKLSFLLGHNIKDEVVYGNISDMPHLLIAGTTGSGKSVGLNTIIMSLIMKNSPEELGLVLIDPKYCEFNVYKNLPHLLNPVINTGEEAITILDSMVDEMNNRLKMFEKCGYVKDLKAYNDYQKKRNALSNKLPAILIVIDEFADLITDHKKEIEELIKVITAKSRASGIYLILATQSPYAEIVTGVIKANIPSRIAFAVPSHINSKVILDECGAEKLLGKGDMLYKPITKNHMERVQGYYIQDSTVNQVVKDIHNKYQDMGEVVQFDPKNVDLLRESGQGMSGEVINMPVGVRKTFKDELCKAVIDKFITVDKISVSMIQKEFGVGTQRACNIFAEINKLNIVDLEGARNKPKKFLITEDEWFDTYSKKYN